MMSEIEPFMSERQPLMSGRDSFLSGPQTSTSGRGSFMSGRQTSTSGRDPFTSALVPLMSGLQPNPPAWSLPCGLSPVRHSFPEALCAANSGGGVGHDRVVPNPHGWVERDVAAPVRGRFLCGDGPAMTLCYNDVCGPTLRGLNDNMPHGKETRGTKELSP
jgi:hypothetical protein